MRRILPILLAVATLVGPAASRALPGAPHLEGSDVPPAGPPAATVVAISNERWECAEGPRTRTIDVPAGDWRRIVVEVTVTPDGDPWDRIFGVAIEGVEVMRGTTPRTAMMVQRDITEYASLLPPGGIADVSLYIGSYVGALLGSVTLQFYDGSEPTAAVARTPAGAAVGAFAWRWIAGGGRTGADVTFPTQPPSSASVELTMSGHGSEEFWYTGQKAPRIFHVLVDGQEAGTIVAMPYVYALLGFGNENANIACVGPGTSFFGDTVHPVMWWSGHRALNAAGVHTGNGEIPPYRAVVEPDLLPLLTGSRRVEVALENGVHGWATSLSFILE